MDMESEAHASQSMHAASKSCALCDKLFYAPETEIEHRGRIKLSGNELRLASKAGCVWCSVQWQEIIDKCDRKGCRDILEMDFRMKAYLIWGIDYSCSPPFSIDDSFLMFYGLKIPLGSDQDITIDFSPALEAGGQGHPDKQKQEEKMKAVTEPVDLPKSTSSKECRLRAMEWLEDCLKNHAECQNKPLSWLPTRSLDLEGSPKLVSTWSISKQPAPPYVTLSHRWGATPGEVYKLNSANESDLMESIPLDQLSQTFRDAIAFTQSIGIRYLWIDSLCIMQDSEEDWKIEAAMMDRVYMQSILNIAANPPSTGGPGMFQERPPERINSLLSFKKTIIRKDYSKPHHFSLGKNSQSDNDRRVSLHKRGWVVQERLLSPRTLHFTDLLLWECRTRQASETFPRRIADPLSVGSTKNLEGTNFSWYSILDGYLPSALTFPSDRLVALGGIAKAFQKLIQDEYCAGFWRKEMPACLTWCLIPEHGKGALPNRQSTYRCPTWSWGSLDFTNGMLLKKSAASNFFIRNTRSDDLVKIIYVALESLIGNVYTQITNVVIKLQGKIARVELSWLGEYGLSMDEAVAEDCPYMLDLGRDAMKGEDLWILPLIRGEDSEGEGNVTGLLLRKCEATSMTFERVGVAILSFKTYPTELEWVIELAGHESPLSELPHTIQLV